MVPWDFCQKNKYITYFTSDDIISKPEVFTKYKLYISYLTKTMRTEWIKMLEKYWDGGDKPYSSSYYFWPQWLFKYNDELPICEAIETYHLTWNTEQYRLTP